MICLAATVILLILTGYDLFQRKNFQKVEGEVVSVGWRGDLQTENLEEYIMVRYMADGIPYVAKQQVISRSFYKEGKKVTVYYDKKDPHKILNRLRLPVLLVLFVLSLSGGLVALSKSGRETDKLSII